MGAERVGQGEVGWYRYTQRVKTTWLRVGLAENKSDISYPKTSRAFDVLIHSGKPNSVAGYSDSVGTTSI